MTQTQKNSEQIARLDERVMDVQHSLEKVMDNHLPHIQARLDSIERRLAYWAGGIAVAVPTIQYIIQHL